MNKQLKLCAAYAAAFLLCASANAQIVINEYSSATSTFLEVGLIPSTNQPISFPRTVIGMGPDPNKMILRTLAYYHKPENCLSAAKRKNVKLNHS